MDGWNRWIDEWLKRRDECVVGRKDGRKGRLWMNRKKKGKKGGRADNG